MEDKDGASKEAKDKFREALERKRNRQHPHEAASQNDSKVHSEHAPASGKRQFRRKSGP